MKKRLKNDEKTVEKWRKMIKIDRKRYKISENGRKKVKIDKKTRL
jgi:hypothetical protein